MLGFTLFNMLFVSHCAGFAAPVLEETFHNNWIPIAQTEVPNQVKNAVTQTNSPNAWMPSEPIYARNEITLTNEDIIKENAIQIITPEQVHKSDPNIYSFSTPVNKQNISVFDNTLEVKDTTILQELPINKEMVSINKTEAQTEFKIESHHRTSKQIENHNFVNDIENLYDKVEENDQVSIKKSYIDNNGQKTYEVTETSTIKDQIQDTDYFSPRYIYKQPIVVPGLSPTRNVFSNKFVHNLSKYNIKSSDALHNYAVSKSRMFNHDNMFFNMFRPQVPSVVAIPFRYNSLNHIPVRPLLAAYLSNYGYYLQGSDQQLYRDKNWLGNSASNQFRHDNPLSSYKMLPDTDSSH